MALVIVVKIMKDNIEQLVPLRLLASPRTVEIAERALDASFER